MLPFMIHYHNNTNTAFSRLIVPVKCRVQITKNDTVHAHKCYHDIHDFLVDAITNKKPKTKELRLHSVFSFAYNLFFSFYLDLFY